MVYFVQSISGRLNNLIKIGHTRRMAVRLPALRKQYQCDDLEPLGIVDGYKAVESKLHRRFALAHVDGEWFQPTQEILDFIRANARPWNSKDDWQVVQISGQTYRDCQIIWVFGSTKRSPEDVIEDLLSKVARKLSRRALDRDRAEKQGIDGSGQLYLRLVGD